MLRVFEKWRSLMVGPFGAALALAATLPALAAGPARVDRNVRATQEALEVMSESVQAIEARMYSLRNEDGDDERQIRLYYEGVKQDYLMRPMAHRIAKISTALDTYIQDIHRALAPAKDLPKASKNNVNLCLSERGLKELDDSLEEIQESLRSAQSAAAATPRQGLNTGRFTRYIDVSTGSRLSDAATALSRIGRTDPAEFFWYCVGKMDAEQTQVANEILEQIARAKKNLSLNLAEIGQKNSLSLVPDPLGNGRLNAFQVAQVLRKGSLQNFFRQLRGHASGAMTEQEIWDQIVPTCEREKLVVERKEAPWKAAKAIGKQIFNDAICTYLPSWGTAKWKMSSAQTTIGLAMALHQSGLLKCDPGTLEALAAQRTPEADLKRLGFDVLKNKAYIDRIFTLMPHTNPLGMVAQVGDGSLLTNVGWFGGPSLTPKPLMQGLGATAAQGARDPASMNVVSGPLVSPDVRIAPSRGKGQAVASLGQQVGEQLSSGVRAASESIASHGAQSLSSARVLRRGAADSSQFVSQVSSQQDTLGSQAFRRERSRVAASVRGATQNLAMAAAAVNSVRSLRRGAVTSSNRGESTSVFGSGASQVGSLSNTIESNRQQRNVNATVAKSIADAISTAVGKSGEYIDKMRKLAIQYKEEIMKAEQKVLEASPPDQYKISIALNAKLESIVGKIAPLYAAYYALGPMINEQYNTMLRLYNSTNGLPPQIPGLAQVPGFGGVPQGFPSAFSTNPPTLPTPAGSSVFGSSSSSTAFLRRLEVGRWLGALVGIPEALAEAQLETEKAWSEEWQKFVSEYNAYAGAKEAKLAEQTQRATEIWQRSLDDRSTRELSAEQIEANQIFVEALRRESEALVQTFGAAENAPGKSKEFEIVQDLKATLVSARELQEGLDRSNRNFLKNYPVTPDDHLTAWKKTLTTLLLESGE